MTNDRINWYVISLLQQAYFFPCQPHLRIQHLAHEKYTEDWVTETCRKIRAVIFLQFRELYVLANSTAAPGKST